MGADKRGMTQNARTGSKGAGDLAAPPPPRPAQWPTPQPARSVRTFLPLRPAGCARRDGETQREAGAWSKRRSLSLLIYLFFKFQVWREASKDPGIFIFFFFPKCTRSAFCWGQDGEEGVPFIYAVNTEPAGQGTWGSQDSLRYALRLCRGRLSHVAPMNASASSRGGGGRIAIGLQK